jgi:hypothetical protein
LAAATLSAAFLGAGVEAGAAGAAAKVKLDIANKEARMREFFMMRSFLVVTITY